MNRLMPLAGAVLIGAGLVVGVALPMWDRDTPETPASSMDASTAVAADCGPVLETTVESSNHVDDGPIEYAVGPPAAGDHRSRWAYFSRNFYDTSDRPDVGELVHNLEHGYNVLWYDETVANDTELLAEVRTLAESYDGGRRDPATALIAAPWTASDGPGFPDQMNFALTHWYADPDDRTGSRSDERGLTRYCAGLSRDAVARWMATYPLADSPEGFPGNM